MATRTGRGLLDIHRLGWLKTTRWPIWASVKQCKHLFIMQLQRLALGMSRAFAEGRLKSYIMAREGEAVTRLGRSFFFAGLCLDGQGEAGQ